VEAQFETPVGVNATSLILLKQMGGSNPAMINAIIEKVERAGENPKEFYAEVVDVNDSKESLIRLWHISAFQKYSILSRRDPSGKSRDMYYDHETKQITTVVFWQ
jgi:hypothetical protein